jgi:hypothetical protein
MNTKEFLYPFPAKPAGGQVNTFGLLTYLLIQSQILKCISKLQNKTD